MEDVLIKVSEEFDKKTVLDILNKLNLTKNAIKNLKFKGNISVNGENKTVRAVLNYGDAVKLHFFEEPSKNIESVKMPIDVLYEDENILAVNKPPYMATHPSQNNYNNTLANAVMAYYNGNFTFRALTRLDKYTSGVVIIAKNAVSASIISKQLYENSIKTYYAILDGVPAKKEDTIVCPIGRSDDSIIKRCIRSDGKKAETHYKIIKEKNGISLAEVIIKTGRTHQIRVHMSHIGCPVYSDFLYGREIEGARLCLHCKSLEFFNPLTQKQMFLSARMPDDMQKIIS